MQHIAYLRDSKTYPVEIEQLKAEPIEYSEIYIDVVNAKSLRRPELEKCIASLNADKRLHVQSADRLARSAIQLRGFVEAILETEASIHFHEEGFILTDDDETKTMLRMLECVADLDSRIFTETMLESKFIKKRSAVKKTKFTYSEDEMILFYKRHENGESATDIASGLTIGTSSLYRIFKRIEEKISSVDRIVPR